MEHDLFGKPASTFPDHALSDQPGEQVGVHIAAGQNGDGDFVAHVDLAGHERRERARAARLDHELQLGKRESNGGGDFLVARHDAGVDPQSMYRVAERIFTYMDRRALDGTGDYLNCPFNKVEYERFLDELIAATAAVGTKPQKDALDELVKQERLLPIADLAQTLVL